MIHRFRVQNFKSLLDVTVDLAPVTVLVGRGGTGKSNFVESIRTLRDIIASPENHHRLQQSWQQMRPAVAADGPTRFEVEFSINGIPDRFRYHLALGNQENLSFPLDESLVLGDTTLFHQTCEAVSDRHPPRGAKWVTEPDLAQVPQAGPLAIGRIPSISEIVVALTALTSGIGCYVFPDKVLSGSRQDAERGAGNGPAL
jgi:hypothetical protein